MASTKKYILKQTKEQHVAMLTATIERTEEFLREVWKEHDGEMVPAVEEAIYERDAALTAMDEWKDRRKQGKKKIAKRVDWQRPREDRPRGRTVDKEALREFHKSRDESKKEQVGIEWLHEGALVTRRGQMDMMIVTRIQGNTVECLNGTATRWFRNVALRPADWTFED